MKSTSEKICIISIHFLPMKTSCAVQMEHLAKEFSNNGHDVTLITPTSSIKEKTKLLKHDKYNVFKFRSLKIVDLSFMRRAINELLLPLFFFVAYFMSPLRKKNFDYVIWYSPSIFLSPVAWFLKKRTSSKAYLILRDIFPEWTLDLGLMKPGAIYNFFKIFASLQYMIADKIGIQSKSNFYSIKNYVSNSKVEVLNNWITDINYKPNPASEIFNNQNTGEQVLIYLGNMGIAQDMDSLIGLAEIFQKKNYLISFLFVGRGTEVERLKSNAKKYSLQNLKFYDEIPSEQVPNLLKKCSAGLIALDPRHNTHNIPGKFISYIQSGLPIIARINPDSDLEEIIRKNDIGIVYSDKNLESFSNEVNNMLKDTKSLKNKSINSRKLYEKKFTTNAAYRQLINGFKKLNSGH